MGAVSMNAKEAVRLARLIGRSRLSYSNIAGQASEDEIAVRILAGSELGLGPVESVAKLYVREGRVEASADVIESLARRGGYQVTVQTSAERGAEYATVTVEKDGTGGSVTWDLERAETARLTMMSLFPLHPVAVLRGHAVGEAVRTHASEVLGPIGYEVQEGAAIVYRGALSTSARRAEESAAREGRRQATEGASKQSEQLAVSAEPKASGASEADGEENQRLFVLANRLPATSALRQRVEEIRGRGVFLHGDVLATAIDQVERAVRAEREEGDSSARPRKLQSEPQGSALPVEVQRGGAPPDIGGLPMAREALRRAAKAGGEDLEQVQLLHTV